MPVLKIKQNGTWVEVWGALSGSTSESNTFIIEDSAGNQLTGVVVDEFTLFTATDEDVKEGKVYAGDSGVSTGTHICE